MKKVVVTKGKFNDYIDEIQQSYGLGFRHYRLQPNVEGTYAAPIRVYSGKVYVLDDVATMEVSDWYLETDTINSKLVYFVKSDGVVVLPYKEIEDPLELEVGKEILVIKDPLEDVVQLENVALQELKVLLERLVKWDRLEGEMGQVGR